VAAVVALVAGVVGGAALTWWFVRGDDPAPPPAAEAPVGGGWPAAGASRTVTVVRADGALEVTQRIHADEPLDQLELSLPDPDGDGTVRATQVEVVADGAPASGPEDITFTRSTYVFPEATRILVRYRLLGAVERSTSAAGRGLVTTTSLDVSTPQAEDTRVVRSEAVLSMACARSAAAELAPCGEADDDGQWTVRLSDPQPGARVVAAVTVPS
jgi:hypothetical protein